MTIVRILSAMTVEDAVHDIYTAVFELEICDGREKSDPVS